MPIPLAAPEVLDREFLEIRAKTLEIAAALDRLERAEGNVDQDPRLARIRQALDALSAPGADRAERIQLIYSLPYQADWRQTFKLDRRG